MGENVLGVAVCEINGLLCLALPEPCLVTTTSLHLVDLPRVAFGSSVSAVIDRWEQAAQVDLFCSWHFLRRGYSGYELTRVQIEDDRFQSQSCEEQYGYHHS